MREQVAASAMTRRRLLKAMGVGVGVLAAGPLLAACGDDDEGSEATGAGNAGSGTEPTGTGSPDVGAELAEMLGIEEATAGGGMDWQLGAVLAFSGAGAYYGTTMTRGTDLAVKHIAAAGGPNIEVIYKDHKSGDAQAGVNAMRELGLAKVPAKLASYADNLGSMLEGTAQYKCFTLDGGGGTSIFAQGAPFFYGTRAITPNDAIPGLLRWMKEEFPDAETVGFGVWDLGEPVNSNIQADVLSMIEEGGWKHNGLYEYYPVGTSDFASVLPKIRENTPDVLMWYGSGQDPGHFVNQYLTSGIDAPVMHFEFTPDGIEASKGTYERGFTFAADYFDANNPVSPLSKLFVREFEAEYGEKPDFYAANFYENTLVMWEVIRRVLAAGGDINDGAQLDAAFQENLTAVSVYGGTEDEIGSYTIDPVTHSVSQRPMGVFTYEDGEVTPRAYYNIDGADFELA